MKHIRTTIKTSLELVLFRKTKEESSLAFISLRALLPETLSDSHEVGLKGQWRTSSPGLISVHLIWQTSGVFLFTGLYTFRIQVGPGLRQETSLVTACTPFVHPRLLRGSPPARRANARYCTSSSSNDLLWLHPLLSNGRASIFVVTRPLLAVLASS